MENLDESWANKGHFITHSNDTETLVYCQGASDFQSRALESINEYKENLTSISGLSDRQLNDVIEIIKNLKSE